MLIENSSNPFANPEAFSLQFSDDGEETVIVDKEEEKPSPKNPLQEEPNKEKEVEDILDQVLTISDEEVEEAAKETKAALSGDEDDFDYTAIAKQNVKLGIWSDYEDSDNLELTKETFTQLLELQENSKKTEIEKSILDAQLPEEKEYFEFKKNGGNLDSYYKARQRQQNVQNLDINTDTGKQNAVYTYYKNVVGWDEARILKHIEKSIKDLDIDEEAQYAYDKISEMVNKEKEDLLAAQKEFALNREKQINEYKGTLREKMKSSNFDSNKIKTAIDSFTKYDETGLAPIDKTFIAFKSDPEKAVELWKYLTDPDKYIQEATKKSKEKESEKIFLSLKDAKKSDTTSNKPITLTKKNTSPFT